MNYSNILVPNKHVTSEDRHIFQILYLFCNIVLPTVPDRNNDVKGDSKKNERKVYLQHIKLIVSTSKTLIYLSLDVLQT